MTPTRDRPDGGQEQHGGWHDPEGTADEEMAKGDAPGFPFLREETVSDQESADSEKDLNPQQADAFEALHIDLKPQPMECSLHRSASMC